MKKLFLALIFFLTVSVNAIETPSPQDIVLCEPSLIFSDMFALEDPMCFSHTIISEISSDTGMLLSYLDSHQDEREQHFFRFSYYLRTKSFFPALITFIHIVNIGAIDASAMNFEKEFSNTIAGGIKASRDSKLSKVYEQRDQSKPMYIKEFSANFFAVASYLASVDKTPQDSKEDSDLKILSMSFKYIFSNFFTGIDFQNDHYLKTLFNRLLKLKNAKLLNSYLKTYFYFLKKRGPAPQYKEYRLLKNEGAIASFDEHLGNNIASSRMKKIFASFYLDNIEKMPQIEYSDASVDSIRKQSDSSEICSYLSKRADWLKNLIVKDPGDIDYNESVMMVENCPGSFHLPFLILNNKIIVEKDHKWITDIAIALKYLMDNNVEQKNAQSILNGAVRSSLSKTNGSNASQFADILYFFYFTDQSPDLLYALYSKQIGQIKKDVSDPVNWAAEFLSSTLF